jgi:hypothetical protein
VILKLTQMQACSISNIVSPIMAMGMTFLCKYSTHHSDFMRHVTHIVGTAGEKADVYEVVIILCMQLIPAILVDVVKLCLLRNLGFDSMAFWKAQKDLRRVLGKISCSFFSSAVLMLILLNQDDPQDSAQ